ncbi:DNA topoisomerase VI subunit B [Vulgatibacter incomptus]|uniref:Type 2 DNA topoisomerase 6 subunit B n=1 Tax=Vulgatibacter incomptus TaxID=1391653 RepID=A0A0K1PEX0_9BACT|nr:DNA topoisomerase VI subunit B [Vulgatibacter incomptus]AKU92065.1 DNA topoisomerase VI subunit B [Vulgatibacter incomptus]
MAKGKAKSGRDGGQGVQLELLSPASGARATAGKASSGKAGASKAGASKAGAGKAGAGKAGAGKAGAGKAGAGKAGAGKAGAGKAGAGKTGAARAKGGAKAPAPRSRAKAPPSDEIEVAAEAETPASEAPAKPRRKATAEQMAQRQREISVSEFFAKNRHLLGFDSPTKALLTTVKEAVDNSLDACEESGILPDLTIEIRAVPGASDRFVVSVEDNGPGIVKAQVPKIFGKLLYGSKFHRLKQSRGQQGIGISAAAMYGQITTGKPVQVWTKTGKGRPAHRLEVQLDTRKNVPVVLSDTEVDLEKDHGTTVELELQADYGRGQRYLLRYVEQTVLANPHLALTFLRPGADPLVFPRASTEPPKEALEIKPHPHGVEVGTLMLMATESKYRDVRSFLQNSFSRVSGGVADEILGNAGLKRTLRTQQLADDRELAEKLRQGILDTRIMAPSTNCLSPIGDELIRQGLISFLSVVEEEAEELPQLELLEKGARRGRKKAPVKTSEEKQAELEKAAADAVPPEPGEEIIKGKKFFIVSSTRPPKVYRGNPFQVEVGLAYGGDWPQDKTIELYRFANRVPLLFQRGACGVTDAVMKTDWKKYELQQPRGALPVGPMALLVHIASVWVPFTSESKEAIAHYPELLAEIRLALQDCGRKLAAFIRKRKAAAYELKRRSIFELYIDELARSLHEITGADREKVKGDLVVLAREITGGEETDEILDRVASNPKKRRPTDEELEAEEER